MDIQLKNIKIAETLSEETIAFTADLYIDSKCVGYCSNEGRGGPTSYHANKPEHRNLIIQAEDYCKKLPPVSLGIMEGKEVNTADSLEFFIDRYVADTWNGKAKKKFEQRKARDMKTSILFGDDESYTCFNFSKPLSEILKYHINPVQFLNDHLVNIAKKMKPGQRILNTNLPEGVIIPEPK